MAIRKIVRTNIDALTFPYSFLEIISVRHFIFLHSFILNSGCCRSIIIFQYFLFHAHHSAYLCVEYNGITDFML